MAFRVVRKRMPLFRPWDAAEHETQETDKSGTKSETATIHPESSPSSSSPLKSPIRTPSATETKPTVDHVFEAHPRIFGPSNVQSESTKIELPVSLAFVPDTHPKSDLLGLQFHPHHHPSSSSSSRVTPVFAKLTCDSLPEWAPRGAPDVYSAGLAVAPHQHHPFDPSLYPPYPLFAPGSILDSGLQARWRTKKQRPKRFQCPHCKVSFSNNGQLKGHVRIHTGERPFACDHPDCGKTFTRNEELTRHKRIHSGLRPFACALCGKSFGRKDHLKKHVRTHQRSQMPPPHIPPYLLPPHCLSLIGHV